ncbi:MAG: MFS transporter [Desulfomonile tiedjei]|nr:MFS transporter [Desulfomonile tiedjei]
MKASAIAQPRSRALGQAITASTVGNILEWFDFAVYGYMAPYIGPLFFPSHDPVASTIAAFAVFAIGYLARPLGALVLGRVGDRVGRRTMLVISITILGASSCAIGLLPTHESIGNFAPVLLVLMRLAQGFSVGGEYTGSMAYASEVSPHGHRGLLSSLATTGTMMGILLSSMAVWLVRSVVGPEALAAWGWRIPFLMGLVVMVFGILIRTRIPETLHEDGAHGERTMHAFTALRAHWREVVQAIGIVTGANVVLYLMFVFVIHIAVEAGASHVEEMNTIGLAVTIPATVLGGWLSDRLGRKRVSLITNLAMAVLAVPAFSLSVWFAPWPGGPSPGPTVAFLVGQLLMAVPMGLVFGVQGVMISEMLPRDVRCTVFSVSYSLAMGLFAGTAPMVAEWMMMRANWHLGPAFYMVGWLAVALWCISRRRETAYSPLD